MRLPKFLCELQKNIKILTEVLQKTFMGTFDLIKDQEKTFRFDEKTLTELHDLLLLFFEKHSYLII